jgi:hypothetical protein
VLETVVEGREDDADEFFRAARLALDGYEKVTPLEPGERRIIGELLAARMCAGVVIPASRAGLYDDPDALMPHLRGQAVKVLRLFESLGWAEVRRRLGGRAPGEGLSVGALAERRSKAFGPAVTAPTYREPLHLVGGEGVWLIDADGRRYLDAYNNVPVVGHEHPRVVEAIVRQARRLNTNARYLHETAIEVAERLVATTGGALDVVMFVNSGSEANDVAWRIARAATGGSGAVTTDWAYHGITEATNALTPEEWGSATSSGPRAHLAPTRPTARLRRQPGTTSSAPSTIAGRGRPSAGRGHPRRRADQRRHHRPCRRGWPPSSCERTRDAGALWIADEVQSRPRSDGRSDVGLPAAGDRARHRHRGQADGQRHAHCRGDHPPRAGPALLTRRRVLLHVRRQPGGGGRGAGRAGSDRRRAASSSMPREVGEYLAGGLRELAARHALIGEVRAIGLAIGVEIVRPGTTEPDPATTKEIVEGMRQRLAC